MIRHTIADLDTKSLRTDGAGLAEGVLAEFTGTLTTATVDRDHDLLESKGASLDPRMPLLLNHDTNRIVGKFVETIDRDDNRIVGKFAILDSELGRDALRLVKAGAVRLSIGFKPHDYAPRDGGKGFNVKSYEVVETSLVPVPANRDAVITGLAERKFHNPEFVKALFVGTEDDPMPKTAEPDSTKSFTEEDVTTIVGKALDDFAQRQTPPATERSGPTPDDLLAAAKGGSGIVVKRASDRYSGTKATGRHVKTGEPVRNENGREVELPSESEHARAGAFLKHLAARAGIGQASLDDHGRELLEDCFKHDRWAGAFGSEWRTGVEGERVKSLLNDSVSGGSEVVPEFFDADLITFPLLHGELFPHIDLRPVPRGASVEAASVGNPIVTWNVAEGTEIPLFDTSALVGAINTSIHTVTVAVEVGRDFLADSPADVGRILLENIGQRMQAELDRIIAVGDGTTEPEGIFNASGTTAVNSDNGGSGPPSLADYETLLFSVGKQYRSAAMRCAFLSNDTSYRRRTGIRIDSNASPVDQRPVFGMTHNDYQSLGWPHRVQNDVANTKIAFGALSKFRLYRRMGMSVEWAMGGKELTRRNLAMLVVRARFGGQVVDPNAFAVMADAQS